MDEVTKRIATFAKKTINLDELQQLLNPFFSSYTDFAEAVREFERHQVLVMIRASGRTIRTPALANRYRINKSAMSGDYHKELQHYRSKLHRAISLDSYYRSDPELWARDLPDLIKVDHYLKNHGFRKKRFRHRSAALNSLPMKNGLMKKAEGNCLRRPACMRALKSFPSPIH
ncbi:hypothetical protein NBRC111894_1737 [Sporolactobacillus inulinus]|uniref:Uncharacterized protein n=1 Tax=Sporolactobacillus inulinus TaxID=2078 RepID=A0A4Y1ZB81_9BACL|nr:hypothetical protein [Sporolactobacillus inulinus]GAY76183.1 hypothetical protein NBRC111894_1737 [Sporolactobacillus inulinus]